MPIRVKDLFWPLVALAVMLVLRHQVVENTEIALSCDVQPWSLACAPRTALVFFAYHQYLGILALVLAGLALWRPTRLSVQLALAVSMAGLTLYSYEPAAAALLLSAMALVRMNENERSRTPAG